MTFMSLLHWHIVFVILYTQRAFKNIHLVYYSVYLKLLFSDVGSLVYPTMVNFLKSPFRRGGSDWKIIALQSQPPSTHIELLNSKLSRKMPMHFTSIPISFFWFFSSPFFMLSFTRVRRIRMFLGLLDLDPLVRGYGSGSGSGSFYHQAKVVLKTLIPTVFLT
jgi:hypothetical protein